MIHKLRFFLLIFLLFFTLQTLLSAQTQVCAPDQSSKGNVDEKSYPAEHYILRNILCDQVHVWSSPFRFRLNDMKFLVPFAGITTGLIVTDRTTSFELTRGSHINASKHLSDAGIAALGASTIAFYGLGRMQGNDHLRETGVLAGEAMIDTIAIDEAFKYGFGRDRPFEGDMKGHFFRSSQSFVSEHAGLSWTFAAVVANEYPGWLTKTLAYGTASAISFARVTGKQHYLSDVFVGGALGYLTGKYVYKAHHNPEFGGEDYGTFIPEAKALSLGSMGSTYVPLDSWIYPALERLAAMGIIRIQFLGLRPWTRMSIAQMLSEAEERNGDEQFDNPEVQKLYEALKPEFSRELQLVENGGVNESIRVDSLYTQSMYIAGRPLNDSYHFGQTIINDFGRPYQGGYNNISGFSARAEQGRFAFYVRGEYQHAPGAAAYPLNVREVIAQADLNPIQPAAPVPSINQFRLLDTYTSFTAFGNQLSIGKQSLWWGTGENGAMALSDNAEPIYMLRINRTIPLSVPLLSKLLGPLRYDNFFGKLSGHHFPPDPFFYGDKLSFRPTENLELGFTRTAVFAGRGKTPLTFGTFWRSFSSVNDVPVGDKGTPRDPGARHGAFDFSYRLPFLRRWITLYSDSIVHDDVSPIDAPRRAFFTPGIYVSHFPKLSKLDLRAESGYTDNPVIKVQNGKFVYWETVYHDAYINKGNLLGSWIGRQGKGTQIWSNYWLSPLSAIQVSYRNGKIASAFIPGGATQNDFSAGARLRLREDVELLTNFQYERWSEPVLAKGRNSDFTTMLQLTFWPKTLVKNGPQ